MKRNRGLDGLRGMAVLMVFLYHTIGIPADGHLGVDIFFVLSGFLITAKLVDEFDRTGRIYVYGFYAGRVLRLIPAFLGMCGLYEALAFLFSSTVTYENPLRLFAFLFTANIYWMQGIHPYPAISHVWTLATEWQFYLAWPFIAAWILRHDRRKVAATLSACAAALWCAQSAGLKVPQFEGILIGASLAILRNSRHIDAPHMPRNLAIIAAGGAFILSFFGSKIGITSSVITVFLTAVSIYAMTGDDEKTPVLSGPIFQYFGKISYGLYLYHFPIVGLMYMAGLDRPRMLVAGLLVAIPLADFSFRFIEEPVLGLRGSRRRDVEVTPETI